MVLYTIQISIQIPSGGKIAWKRYFLPGLNAHGVTGWKDIRLPKAAGNTDNDVIEAGTL